MLEVYGNDTSTAVFTNIPNVGTKQQEHLRTVDLSAAFHTYGLDWEPGSITWYLDGKAVFHVTSGVSDQSMYLLANLAISGKVGEAPDASTPTSGSFEIRSVTIWRHSESRVHGER